MPAPDSVPVAVSPPVDPAELAEAEVRAAAAWADTHHRRFVEIEPNAARVVLAEYDRRGAELARVPSDMAVLRGERDRCAAALDAARAEVERLAVSLLEEKREHLAAINVRDELTAQRGAVLEIHRIYPAAPAAAPYCEECPSDLGWPCSTARALGVE